jgi:hypothetical protein
MEAAEAKGEANKVAEAGRMKEVVVATEVDLTMKVEEDEEMMMVNKAHAMNIGTKAAANSVKGADIITLRVMALKEVLQVVLIAEEEEEATEAEEEMVEEAEVKVEETTFKEANQLVQP